MSKLEKILALVRSINQDEFQEQLTHGDSLDDVYEELLFLAKKIDSKKKRTAVIVEQISNCFAGDFFNYLPISEENDELDVFCMGFNTYIEELKSAMVSKKLLETINEKLAEEKERTEQLVSTKDQCLSGMSHEIRTPLNGIIGFANLLLNCPSLDTENKEQLEYIKMSADVLKVAIDDILDLAKIESGQMFISDKPFNLIELIRLLRETFLEKITEKGIDTQFFIDKEVPSLLCGDSVRISQILSNLMSYAIKLTPVNGKIRLKIKLQDEDEGFYSLRITLKYSGTGMTARQLEGVFEPFVSLSNGVASQNEGTGLGLTIVKKIVNLMGGEIVVKSKVNLGTKFTVTLPFSKRIHYSSSSKSSFENENKVSVSVDSNKKIKVLLAEDDRINQILVQKVLSTYNVDCVVVENGSLAVDALIQDDFDLVLMDLMMPVLNGYEAASKIRKLKDHTKKNIPILALSAIVTDTVADACKAVGMDEYLSKPFDAEELYNVITGLIIKKNNSM